METAIDAYALTVLVLFAKMVALSAYQSFHRITRRHFTVPEDARLANRPPAERELPAVERAARAWRNDLESVPIFLGLGVAYVLVGAAPAAAPWLFGAFAAARIAHTACYLAALQPWRTAAFFVGLGCQGLMALMIVIAVAA